MREPRAETGRRGQISIKKRQNAPRIKKKAKNWVGLAKPTRIKSFIPEERAEGRVETSSMVFDIFRCLIAVLGVFVVF